MDYHKLNTSNKEWMTQKDAENSIINNKQEMINLIQQYDKEKLTQTVYKENKEILEEKLNKIKLQNEFLKNYNDKLKNNNKKNKSDTIQDYSKFNKKEIVDIFEESLNNIIEKEDITFKEEQKKYFGLKSKISELYFNSNYMIILIKFISNISNLNKDIKIKCSLDFTIKDVLKQACSYWNLDNQYYILSDDKLSYFNENIKLKDIYIQNFGMNKYYFYLNLKNEYLCELEKIQKVSNKNPFINKNQEYHNEVKLTKFNSKNDTNMINLFFEKFTQLKNYIEIDNSLKYQTQKDKFQFKFYSQKGPIYFYIIILIFILYSVILSNFNIGNNYHLTSSMSNILRVTKYLNYRWKNEYLINNYKSFENIRSNNDFYDWLDNITVEIFDRKKNFFLDNIILIGDIRLVQMKTKTYNCGGKICNFIKYNEDTKFKEDILYNGTRTIWGKYKTAKELKTNYFIEGYNTSYDGSGYLLSLGNNNTTLKEVQDKLKLLRNNNYLDEKTLAVNFLYQVILPILIHLYLLI